MASLMLILLLSLGDICLRIGCALLSVLSAVGLSADSSSGSALAQSWLGVDVHERCGGDSAAPAGAWKSSGAGSSGSFASASQGDDLSTGLKLLFLPSLGILVLLAFLLEEGCAAHNQQQAAAAANAQTGQPATGGGAGAGAGGGVCGWLRSWCLRGPRLTSAYQAQLQANAAALVLAHTQQHAVHAHMTHMAMHHGGTGVCCGGLNCAGAISNGSPPKKMLHAAPSATAIGTAASALDHGGGGPGSSGSMVAPLSLRLDGYNHLHNAAGPLLYYEAFQRELPVVIPTQQSAVAVAHSVSAVADPKPEEKYKQQSTKQKKKQQAATDAAAAAAVAASMDEKASVSPRSASPAPSSPKLPPSSPSSSSSAAATSGLPPASEFVPLTLVNSSTGFSCTLRLWSGLTFAEILKHYVASYWTEERSKYEAIEGGGRDEDPEIEVLNAILERAPEPAAAPPAVTSQSKKKQSAAAIAAAAAALAAKQAAAAAAVSSRAPQPPLMLRYQGVRVSPFLTPAAVFPPPPTPPPQPQQPQVQPALPADVAAVVPAVSAAPTAPPPPPPVLEVCIDYILLFDRARLWSHDLLRKESLRVQGCLEMQHKLIAEVARTEGEIAALSKKQRECTDKHTLASNDLKRVSKDAERIAKDLAALVKTRTDLESSMASSVGLVSNARARIESEYRALRAEYDTKVASHTRSKLDYQSLLDSRHESSLALKQSMISCEISLRRLNTLKVAKNKREKLQEKIKKMEAVLGMGLVATGTVPAPPASSVDGDAGSDVSVSSLPPLTAALAMKHRYDLLESEHNVLNVTLNELRLQSHEIDEMSKNENYKLRYRLKLLEKDARDLVKWKSLARSHESEAKEAVQWKNALKQAKARERALEHEYKETTHWKQRARAMEREVRELRLWKARLDAAGLGGEMPAAFARDSLHNQLGSSDFDGGALSGVSGGDPSLLPRRSRTGSMDREHDFASHSHNHSNNHSHSNSQPDLDAAFAASFAAFQQQQQQQHRHGSSALRSNVGDSGISFSASSLHGSGIDADELAELHSSSSFDRGGHYSSAWSSFGGSAGGSGDGGGGGGGGLGMDVAAAAEEPDAEFTHNHPALSFLAE